MHSIFFPCSIMIPLILVKQIDSVHIPLVPSDPMYFCNERWPHVEHRQIYDIFLFVFMFIIPGCFVTISYTRIGCRLWTEGQQLYRNDSEVIANVSYLK